MTNSKHTPGPWGEDGSVVLVRGGTWLSHANWETEEGRANARLMKAAPELLDAVSSFQSYGCPVCGGDCSSANPPVISCPMQMAHAAIAKATGSLEAAE